MAKGKREFKGAHADLRKLGSPRHGTHHKIETEPLSLVLS